MKQITLKMDNELHKAAKIKAVLQDESFMKYVIGLIQKDLETKKEQTQ